MTETLDHLYETILARRASGSDESYVARLQKAGRLKMAQKVGEEGVETALAAASHDPKAVISESADLLFHLAVLWADLDIVPADIWRELERRQGISGVQEKAARPQQKGPQS